MPFYEEKCICPFAIRFSQARIRPTFRDGHVVEKSMSQVEAVSWPHKAGGYDLLLSVPFPPIEIIRWRPKLREDDGSPVVDDGGANLFGEACWFTFDNRRLYCLQAAAVKHWPQRVAAVVHVMHDLPLNSSAARKFRTTDLGWSVRICRRDDLKDDAPSWSWRDAAALRCAPEASLHAAQARIQEDAEEDDLAQLIDADGLLCESSCSATSSRSARASSSEMSSAAATAQQPSKMRASAAPWSPPASLKMRATAAPWTPPTLQMMQQFYAAAGAENWGAGNAFGSYPQWCPTASAAASMALPAAMPLPPGPVHRLGYPLQPCAVAGGSVEEPGSSRLTPRGGRVFTI
mmetsp:Transcript_56154/g.93152  ORF Transcript_56154/g.93152 Transcript_56154/m.93152 type:complete len:347 (-) Transcript_56154:93-1133(-)